ncbi:MAG TPA: PEGA domain-containing protein, partial [Spirochaetia bacterium]|nr:PEGA domain-containing protein [Spirochaetia bacterium]
MDGHEPARSTVAIGDGETVNVSLGLPRSTGTLFVDMPRDGVATITSAEIGQKTISGPGSLNLPTGSYHVIAGSPGLPNASGDVTVGRAETAHWMPWSSGYLDVRSVPPGATVSVDGQDTGTSPVVVPMEPGEVHHVELRLSGYQTISADLIEEAGTKAVFSRTLKAVEDAAAPPAVAAAQPKIGVPVPRAPIEIDGDFARWSTVPALLGGSGHSGDIFLDKVYVAMDQDEEHFFFRIDIADPKAASLFHSSNFDTLHPSSYGIDLMNGSKAVRLHVYYCDTLTLMKGGGRSPAGTVPSRWIVDMDVQDNGTWTVAEDVGARFVMKGSFLEASFPMKTIRHALALPVSGGSCRVDARTGYVDSGFGNGAQDWNRYATPWQLEAGSGETTASTTISF